MLPQEDWPELKPVPGVHYPEFLNASVELLDENLNRGRGDHVAIWHGSEKVTYAELLQRVERFTTSLAKAGIQQGDRIILRLMNTPEFVVAWLSILRIGAVAVATMPLLRARELKAVLEDSGASLAICQDSLWEELEKALEDFPHLPVVVTGSPQSKGHLSFQEWLKAIPVVAPAHTRAEDIALLSYTSGSTGIPKGTVHFHRDLLAVADTYSKHVLHPSQDDVFGGHPTLAFVYGLGGLLLFPFRVGASTVFIDGFTPEIMLKAAREFGITILFCAPTSYKMMMRDYGEKLAEFLPQLRVCVSAGEALPGSVFNEWRQLTGVTILDGIGATEMLHIVISNFLEDARPDCTGRVVPGYEAKIVDADLNEVPPTVEGLLAVRGPTGCRYWNRPQLQKEYVRGGWNFTGDVFQEDADGYFRYSCRCDDMIICGGINIAGPEVENVLIHHPAVQEVAVVASPDELKTFVPKAFVVLTEGYSPGETLARELQDFTKSEIAPYKSPRKVEFVETLPRTSTGKIRRVELREKEIAHEGSI